MFAPTVYVERRKALVTNLASRGLNDGLVIFLGNRESPINFAENPYRFRQDSSFLYFVGLSDPDMAAAIDLQTGQTTLFCDEMTEDTLVWTGPKPGVSALAESSGIELVATREGLSAFCRGKRLAYLPAYRAETAVELSELTGVSLQSINPGASGPLIQAVIALREIKENREIERIEHAVDISIDMHLAVIAAARPGASEAALMAIATHVALDGGGMPSFPPIATTHGAVLHNHGYDGVLQSGGTFLLDAGAETADGYAGDLTSTFPIGRGFDERQRAIYKIVLDASTAASSTIRPGVPYRNAHLAASRTIASGLAALGIMKGSIDEAVAAGAHALFFPHGVGHQMGLDVHDMESLGEHNVGYDNEPKSQQFGLKSLRMAKAVRPGMVLTVEPGVYFIPELIRRWKSERRHEQFIHYPALEAWMDVGGYRNEEDWLVTESGARVLGKEYVKSIDAMESRVISAPV